MDLFCLRDINDKNSDLQAIDRVVSLDGCIRCNWEDCNMWKNVHFNDAVNSPLWKGFWWKCPVCDNYNAGEFPGYDVCPRCGWEDDHYQREEPDNWGGANDLSLNESRLEYRLQHNENTKEKAIAAFQEHRKINGAIYKKYQGIDYRVDGDKITAELKSEHERYVEELEALQEYN